MDIATEKEGKRMDLSDLRCRGRQVLNGRTGTTSHRLTLTLAIVLVLTAGMALYAAVSGLYMAVDILWSEVIWAEVAVDGLFGLLFLALILPLMASVWRLACLMTAPDGEVVDGMPVSVPSATLGELFYPFTSLRAYGRTMAVALEGAAWALLIVGFSALGSLILPVYVIPLIPVNETVQGLLSAVGMLVLSGAALGIFFLSGRRAGFGYFVFVHEDMTVRDVNRYFGGFRRSAKTAFCLRMSLAGWYALSVAAILMPFVFHTIPYTLCCAATYSRNLPRR
ncbi:MAG: hypothetical protein IKU90_00805 [Clostridia bacterium]|nr:hypothetical protein [Clostridia bacterium]